MGLFTGIFFCIFQVDHSISSFSRRASGGGYLLLTRVAPLALALALASPLHS
jgi:hypothetical protein